MAELIMYILRFATKSYQQNNIYHMRIRKYKEFNEEVDWKKLAVGAAVVGGLAVNAPSCNREEIKVTQEQTDKRGFSEYYVQTKGTLTDNIFISIGEDGVIGSSYKQGKVTTYTLTIPKDSNFVYTKTSSWGQTMYGTLNQSFLPGGEKIDLSKLEVRERRMNIKY